MNHYDDGDVHLILGDAADPHTTAALAAGAVRTIVTSPPYYGLRDYDEDAQIGQEETVAEYIDRLVLVFENLRDALADDGTVWVNLGDSYASSTTNNGGYSARSTLAGYSSPDTKGRRANDASVKRRRKLELRPKNLYGVPWRFAFAMQGAGWILRSEIIWAKPNPMPESVRDRPTSAHEHIFMFAKNPAYYYDADAILEPFKNGDGRIGRESKSFKANPDRADGGKPPATAREGGRNKRTVWEVASVPFAGGHFAAYPPDLIRPCIRAGSTFGDTVLDPFSGSGTTGYVARQEGRKYIGIDLNREYLDLSLRTRFAQPVMDIWGGDAA